ncbi:amidohydrolase [Spirochaetia bacterium]|nr:amidohydrolase [Spirochaetia bacterium]
MYDAQLNKWLSVKSITITDGKFEHINSEECSSDIDDFDTYLIPGFIDAHCHLLESSLESEYSEQINTVDLESLVSRAKQNCIIAYKSGITSLKDLGGRGFSSIAVRDKLKPYIPTRIFTSGCYFTSPGGHCCDRGAIILNDIASFRVHIEKLVNSDVKFLKILHGDDGFNVQLLNDMIYTAHNSGMYVSCHAYTEKAANEAVNARTDTLEHAGDYSDNLLDKIKQRDIIIVPTFVAAYDSTTENSDMLNDVNGDLLQKWLSDEKKIIPKLFQKGIMVALGTDSGFPGTPCNSLIREIQLLHNEFGITTDQLMHAAFAITPKTVLMEKKLGRIKDGYYADFLCYRVNPLKNLKHLDAPYEVWINGKKV